MHCRNLALLLLPRAGIAFLLAISFPDFSFSQNSPSKPAQSAPKYTPELIEETRSENESAQRINALVQQVGTAMDANNSEAALGPLQELVALDPNRWQFFSALCTVQLSLGQYDRAVETCDRGLKIAQSKSAVDPRDPSTDPEKRKSGITNMLTNKGNAYLKLHQRKEAAAAFSKAASTATDPATAYFNLCATEYNTNDFEDALDACDKAIAANSKNPDVYFIKGSLLLAGGQLDKATIFHAPPGTSETLNKYLELAPNGAHVGDVQQMLQMLAPEKKGNGLTMSGPISAQSRPDTEKKSARSALLSAPTVDEIIAKSAAARGGLEKLKAVTSSRSTGSVEIGPTQAGFIKVTKRPNKMRSESTIQGLSMVKAYDGQNGWQIVPFSGNKDAMSISGDELDGLQEEADTDGPLVDYKQKGNRVELVGKESIEGTDAFNLKVTPKNGNVCHIYLDAESYLPIKITAETTRRGAEINVESTLGNFKEVNGILVPFYIETHRSEGTRMVEMKITLDKVEFNVPVEDSIFKMPPPAP